jgi:rare lipoprotein A
MRSVVVVHEVVRRHFWKVIIILLVILTALLLAPRLRSAPKQLLTSPQSVECPPECGKASFYGGAFHGRKTANGEVYNKNSLTAAHRTLPMGTRVKVKNLKNGREVIVRINNRGPRIKGRIIDLSTGAARELRMVDAGVVPVEVRVLPSLRSLARN